MASKQDKPEANARRIASVARKTKETEIEVDVNLDGEGVYDINTGIHFFNHMLESLSKHSGIDMKITCKGDLDVDDHHTIEDVAICIGGAIREALRDKKGIQRYGWAVVPMDEALARCALDLSGRTYLVFKAEFSRAKVSDFSTEMVEHFFMSLAEHLKANLHMEVLYGKNTHHKIEALFKSLAVALREAVKITSNQVASTKGVI
ncbi:MAG: imidazoleglycerol-phosphate dehydratase HisB [Chlorobiales bacterium]|nr:imidazoleglycerol-phosphate dehydratase HisB [Chlorobiales bacterium]